MSLRDHHGNPTSATRTSSIDAYAGALELYQRYEGDPLAAVDAAFADEPGFLMGHLFKAAVLVGLTERAFEPALRAEVEAAERAAAGANARERMHLAAARAWLEGDFEGSVEAYGRIALEHPRDALALQTAHLGDFYLGQQTQLRDRLAQALHAWDEREPAYGYLLGMYAFGLEETGDLPRAEEAGRRAAELDPRDAWACHAVAHVLEMSARIDEGVEWLTAGSPHWERCGFSFHNFWHLALYLLDAGEPARALAIYDRRVRPGDSGAVLEMIDASALLWRLHLAGADVGDRFARLADAWAPRVEDRYYAFNDVHALLAFLGAGREREARALLAEVERAAAAPGTNGRLAREVGLPVCRALAAFAAGDFDGCVEHLLPVRPRAVRFGGSNAQRDLLSLTLLEAALRAGRTSVARALGSERVRLRPANPRGWELSARTLDLAGDPGQAAAARTQAARLRARLAAGLGVADRVGARAA